MRAEVRRNEMLKCAKKAEMWGIWNDIKSDYN
jgi:hypothetical protein